MYLSFMYVFAFYVCVLCMSLRFMYAFCVCIYLCFRTSMLGFIVNNYVWRPLAVPESQKLPRLLTNRVTYGTRRSAWASRNRRSVWSMRGGKYRPTLSQPTTSFWTHNQPQDFGQNKNYHIKPCACGLHPWEWVKNTPNRRVFLRRRRPENIGCFTVI